MAKKKKTASSPEQNFYNAMNSGDISTNQINEVLGGGTNKIKGKSGTTYVATMKDGKDELPIMRSAGDRKRYLMGGDNMLYHKGKEFSPEHTGPIRRGLRGQYVKDEDTGEKLRLKDISVKPNTSMLYNTPKMKHPSTAARMSKTDEGIMGLQYNNKGKNI
jgi:hypothetical protein